VVEAPSCSPKEGKCEQSHEHFIVTRNGHRIQRT
jgi:hypothetical protein